jgi:Lrp/AsnC family transcriptional regulator, leucine-responsive regulatory protein
MESLSLDATDLQLLRLLQEDASLSNQALAERVHVSPPTCLRRVKRFQDLGLIERQVAILSADRMKPLIGAGLTAVVELTLVEQTEQTISAMEARLQPEPAVQQCYRVSPGPDLILVVQVQDMPAYLAFERAKCEGVFQHEASQVFYCAGLGIAAY